MFYDDYYVVASNERVNICFWGGPSEIYTRHIIVDPTFAFQIHHSPHGPLTLIVLQHFIIKPACVARRPEGLACKACKTCKTSMLQAIQVCYMQYKHLADSPLGNPIFVNGSFVALGVANIFAIGPITLSFPISFF